MNNTMKKYLISEAEMSQSKLNKVFKGLPTETRNRLVMAIWQYTNPDTIIGAKLFTQSETKFTNELINRLNLNSYNLDPAGTKTMNKLIHSLKLDKEWVYIPKEKVFIHKDKTKGK